MSVNKRKNNKDIANLQESNYWREGKYLGIVSMLLYFAVWFTITRDGLGLVRPIILPSPIMVVDALIKISSVVLKDIGATCLRVLAGFSTGVIVGVGTGLLMGLFKKYFYFLNPLVESARPVPVIAMIPFFLMWFGIREQGKFLLVVMGVTTIMIVSTLEAIRNVPPIYIKAAQTLGANRGQIFRKIIFPAIIPSLIGSLRVAAALSFTLVVASEFMGAKSGVGYRILEARRLFNTDVIFLGIVIFGILAGVLDFAIRKITGYFVRWSERTI